MVGMRVSAEVYGCPSNTADYKISLGLLKQAVRMGKKCFISTFGCAANQADSGTRRK
jgi:tRNA A37 methylthiotransferase MiaB